MAAFLVDDFPPLSATVQSHNRSPYRGGNSNNHHNNNASGNAAGGRRGGKGGRGGNNERVKYHPMSFQSTPAENNVLPDEEDEDFKLALRLQQEEDAAEQQQIVVDSVNSNNTNSTSTRPQQHPLVDDDTRNKNKEVEGSEKITSETESTAATSSASQPPPPTPTPPSADVVVVDGVVIADTSLDADYALALQLQAELSNSNSNSNSSRNSGGLPQLQGRHAKVTCPSAEDYARISSYYSSGGASAAAVDDDDDEDDEDDDGYDGSGGQPENAGKPYHQTSKLGGRRPASSLKPELNTIVTKHDLTLDAIKNAAKLEQFVDSGDMEDQKVGGHAFNALRNNSAKQETHVRRKRGNVKDKSTSDSVMDTSTRMQLYKMLNSGILDELNGVVSTGKESHVYHGVTGTNSDVEGLVAGEECAIKIYSMDMKHSGFKDRMKYVDGEFRYRHTPTRSSRKAIKVWAEKELRNLKRLEAAGILCPRPIMHRQNVLVMSFIGQNGLPAPRLKDAPLSENSLRGAYMQTIRTMRDMYQVCSLVHADLSEYNILYHKKKIYFIDVSQSVENDHENAMDFLRRDCDVMTTFFMRKGITNPMSARELFEFVTDASINDSNIDSYLDTVQSKVAARQGVPRTNEELIEDEVWRNAFIPRKLSEMSYTQARDEVEFGAEVRHTAVTGIRGDLGVVTDVPEILEQAQRGSGNGNEEKESEKK